MASTDAAGEERVSATPMTTLVTRTRFRAARSAAPRRTRRGRSWPPSTRPGRRALIAAGSIPGPLVTQGDRALQQHGVDERLGEVAAELALGDVILLGEQSWRPAGGPVALEVTDRG